MLSASLIASKTDAALFVQSFMYEAPFWTGVKPIYARERREEEAAFVGVKSTVKKKKKKKKKKSKNERICFSQRLFNRCARVTECFPAH